MEFIIEQESVVINGLKIEEVIAEGQFKLLDKNGDIPLFVENIWSESKIILHLLRETDSVMFLTYTFGGQEFKEVIGVKSDETSTPGLKFPVRNPCDFLIGQPEDLNITGWPLGFKVYPSYLEVKWCGDSDSNFFKNIVIQKYELIDFKDFPIEEISITLDAEFKASFEFQGDFIYVIKFEVGDEEIETSPFIKGKPTFYFSSVDRLRKKINSKGLDYIGDEISIKLSIWDLSNEVYAITGLSDPPELLKPAEKHLLENYIETKLAYELVKQNVGEMTFDEEQFKENSAMKSITVTNFSHSTLGVTPYEIMLKGLKEFRVALDDITKEIKNKFYNRMPTNFEELSIFNEKERFEKQRPSHMGMWTVKKSLRGWYHYGHKQFL